MLGNFGVSSSDAMPERNADSYHYVLKPGTNIKDSINISNLDSSYDHLFNLSTHPAKISSENLLSCDQSPEAKNSSWILIENNQINIAAKSTQTSNFRLLVPDTALPGEHNFCIIIEQAKSDHGSTLNVNSVEVSTQVTMRVSVTIPGDFDWNLVLGRPRVDSHGDTVSIVLPQTNTGDSSLATNIFITYGLPMGKAGQSKAKSFIMPGGTGNTTIDNISKSFWGGIYMATVRVEYLPSDSSLASQFQPKTAELHFWYLAAPAKLAYAIYAVLFIAIYYACHKLIKQKYRRNYKMHR